MARPPSNAAHSGCKALSKLPRAPKGMTRRQASVFTRYGGLLVDAGTLAATDLPMLESAARVRATLDAMYADPDVSAATVAALERLHKECLIQLGLTPAARRGGGQRLDAPRDSESDRIRDLLG